jgi:Protein of unknown function (DUF3108)
MATWLKPFLLALLAALCVHALGLVGIGSQMKSSSSVLAKQDDPLFTRTIEAASAAALPTAPKAVTETPSPNAATQIIASQESAPIQPTETLALAPTQTALLAPSSTMAEVQFSTANPAISEPPTLTAAINTPPTQTLTSQPSGQTDTLLTTGEWPADTRVSYVMTGYFNGELHGSGIVQWTRSGLSKENYQVKVRANARGLFTLSMTSQGKLSPTGLLPEAYEEVIDITGLPNRVRSLRLEEKSLLSNNGNRFARPATAPWSVQDTVSQFIDIGHRYQQGREKLEEGRTLQVWLGRPGGLNEWTYDISAEESVFLPKIGDIKVHHLKPRPLATPRGPYTMEMWLAPSLQYLPVKVRFNMNSQSYVDLLAVQIQQTQ